MPVRPAVCSLHRERRRPWATIGFGTPVLGTLDLAARKILAIVDRVEARKPGDDQGVIQGVETFTAVGMEPPIQTRQHCFGLLPPR